MLPDAEQHPELVALHNLLEQREPTPDEVELGASIRAKAAALFEEEAPGVHRLSVGSLAYHRAEGMVVAYLVVKATPSSEGN